MKGQDDHYTCSCVVDELVNYNHTVNEVVGNEAVVNMYDLAVKEVVGISAVVNSMAVSGVVDTMAVSEVMYRGRCYIILHMIRKPHSIIVLLFIQNNS